MFFACTVPCSIGHGVRQDYASTYGAHTVAMQAFLAAFLSSNLHPKMRMAMFNLVPRFPKMEYDVAFKYFRT